LQDTSLIEGCNHRKELVKCLHVWKAVFSWIQSIADTSPEDIKPGSGTIPSNGDRVSRGRFGFHVVPFYSHVSLLTHPLALPAPEFVTAHAGGDDDPYQLSFRGLDNSVFYMLNLEEYHQLLNYSGCGNTVSGNHPVVKDLIITACKRYPPPPPAARPSLA